MDLSGPWYLPVDEKHWQAYDAAAVEKMLRFGAITLKTPVWRTGMDEAAPLGEIDELLEGMTGDYRLGMVEVAASTYAGPWRRCLARAIDLALVLTPGFLLLAWYSEMFEGRSGNRLGSAIGVASFGLTLLALLVEVPLLAATGTTVGKWLVGLSLRKQNGRRISARGLLRRNLKLWAYGLGTGIPFWGLVSLVFSYGRVSKGRLTRWDETTLHRVRLGPNLWHRIADRLGWDNKRKGAAWKNPVTQQIARLPPDWRVYPDKTVLEETYYVLGTHEAVVILARESLALSDLELYAETLLVRASGTYQNMAKDTRTDGVPRIHLHLKDIIDGVNFDVTVRIWRTGEEDYWRLIILQPMGKPRASREAMKVADALEQTVPVEWR